MKTTKKEIATLAFTKLRNEGKKDEALRLAHALLTGSSISLSIGNVDWEIQNAIEYCAGTDEKLFSITQTGFARYNFDMQFELSEEQADKNRQEFYD